MRIGYMRDSSNKSGRDGDDEDDGRDDANDGKPHRNAAVLTSLNFITFM